MPIIIIADDLTGANDTAVAFARRGLRAATVLTARPGALAAQEYEVVAYTTESRALSPKQAYQAVYTAAHAVLGCHSRRPGAMVYKKIDSSLRGPIGAELRALLDAVPWIQRILVAPAFPAMGRTTVAGEQRIDGRPVHRTAMADDPVTPVRVSHIPTLFAEHDPSGDFGVDRIALDRPESRSNPGRYGIHAVPHSIVAAGVDALRQVMAQLPADVRIIVADAVSDADLDVLAQLVWENPGLAPCGSAGLAAAIARRMAGNARMLEATGRPDTATVSTLDDVELRTSEIVVGTRSGSAPEGKDGSLFLIVGSKSPKAREQLRFLHQEAPWVTHVALPLERLSNDDFTARDILRRDTIHGQGACVAAGRVPAALDDVAKRVAQALAAAGVCALYPAVEIRSARVSPESADEEGSSAICPKAITRALAAVSRMVLERSPVDTLLLTGGETAAEVLAALEAEALEIRTEPWPGVASGRIIGGIADGVRVVTKAGSFGDADFLVRLIRRWRKGGI